MLSIQDLRTEYRTDDGQLRAVDDVSFEVDRGQSFGLVGESGCGKSTVAKSIMRILPSNGKVAGGRIDFEGTDLTALPAAAMRRVRWQDVALISQSAMNALDPVYTVGAQIREAIEAHESASREAMDARIAELFELVGIDPERMEDYPHQFSGGMKQRAMIAMALVLNPDLIIADEPTTALDVISQDTILRHLDRLQAETGASLLLITHDMSVVAEMCDRTGVMYAGQLAEVGPTEVIFDEPSHPYTLGLKNAFPTVRGDRDELISIPGSPPDLAAVDEGCRFAERCPFATAECRSRTPPMESRSEGHAAACLRIDEIGPETLRTRAANRATWEEPSDVTPGTAGDERDETTEYGDVTRPGPGMESQEQP